MTSSSHRRNEQLDAFSGIEPPGIRRKVDESSRLFDVFINHRGPDVKQTVALELYNSLTELGIYAFLDSEEKELGHTFPSMIDSAVHSASAHIAIFSIGYAESPWCLEELFLMLQTRAKIVPVFYGVKPSDLRHIESGVYAKAFTKYEEKNRYMEKLKEWKEALQSVSFLAGHEISGNFNISDCKNIVSAVQIEVQRKLSLHVAKYPVGLHRLVEDFERVCLDQLVEDFERQCQTSDGRKEKAQIVGIFGIFGMGGIGKTTLAKELFNRKRSQYTRACFLFDVREAYSTNSFPSLQMKFLKDLFQKDRFNFRSTEEGTAHIGDCIRRSKPLSFLIVLDDIDHVQQLDALLITEILKKSVESLVIVTTRDVGVLISTGITAAYNLKGMDRDDARELFCWHAFGQPHPVEDYENLVNSFLNVCGGLPLSLQVLGSHVNGRDQSYWSLELNKVSKTLPRDIHQRLKISFDALDYEEHQIFMDIACFFVDKTKSIAMEVWEASGWSAQHALETLKNKCLVQEIEEERFFRVRVGEERLALRMHDHLRDLGREMANRLNSPHRLWRPQDLKYLESKGFQNILAQTKGRFFQSFIDEFMRCRITYFVGESDFNADTSTTLLWLDLQYQGFLCLISLQPIISSSIPLQNLRYLIIRNLRHKILWQSHVQAPTQLRVLEIRDTWLREFPDLSGISNNLEKIIIHNWSHLQTMSGLSDLKKLVELNISNCQDLQELSLLRLRCLEKLVLHNCYNLKSVPGISDLRKLVELDISKCPKIEQTRLVGLNSLKHFKVDDSWKWSSFELDGCRNLQTISGILNLQKLVKINIRDSPKLEVLPSLEGPSTLETVNIDGCGKLDSLVLSKSQNLKRVTGKFDLARLCISDCPELEELPCYPLQTCLEKISIVRCGKLPNITLPAKLMELVIEGCGELKTVAAICDHIECLKLQELTIVSQPSCLKSITNQNCDKLQTIQVINYLEKITIDRSGKLTIDGCRKLNSLQLLKCQNLKQLCISDCPELEELPCSALQTCLEKISIFRCGKLQRITLPAKLVDLVIEGCRELKTVAVICHHILKLHEFTSIPQLTCLKRITIQACHKLQTIQGIEDVRALEDLQLFDCPQLKELPCSALQICLEKISIVRCGKLRKITLPRKLVELHIECCRKLTIVAAICNHSECLKLQALLKSGTNQTCDKLQTVHGIDYREKITINGSGKLTIDGCRKLNSLQLLKCQNLKQLFISNCPELEELPCCASQTHLQKISIVRCGKLHNITLPTELVELVIEGCTELKTVATICDRSEFLNLPELSSAPQPRLLKWIKIQSCDKLQTIEGIDELPALESLQLFNCPELEELPCSTLQTCLERITIVRCGKKQNITLPAKLVEVRIVECGELKIVPLICDDSERPELNELSSVARPSYLEWSTIQTCGKLQTLQDIGALHVPKRVQLLYCNNEAIRNCICMLKRALPEILVVIGQAVDGALSILNQDLFSDTDILISEIDTPTVAKSSIVIYCAVVNRSFENRHLRSNVKGKQREWIMTGVTTHSYCGASYSNFYRNLGDFEWHGMIKKGYKLVVKKVEEQKIQHVLQTIIDRLYKK